MAAPKLDRSPSADAPTPATSFVPPPEALADEPPPTRRAPVPSLERVSDKPPALPPVSHTRIRAFAKLALGVVGAAMALSLTACPGNSSEPSLPQPSRGFEEVVVVIPGDGRCDWERISMDRGGCFETVEHHGFDTAVVARGCLDRRDVAGWFRRVDSLSSEMAMVPTSQIGRRLGVDTTEVLLMSGDNRAWAARDEDDAARLASHARALVVAVERAEKRYAGRRLDVRRASDDDDRFAPPPPGR